MASSHLLTSGSDSPPARRRAWGETVLDVMRLDSRVDPAHVPLKLLAGLLCCVALLLLALRTPGVA